MPAREDSGTFYRGSIRDVLTQMSGGPQAPRDPSASPASSCNSSASVEGADFPVDSGGGGHSSEEEEDDECASDTSARLRDVDRRLAANASEVGRGSSKWDWLREADTYKQDPSTPDASPGYVDDGDEEYNDDSDDEGRNERGAAEEDGGRFAFGGEQAFRDEAHSSEEDSGAKKRVPKAPSHAAAREKWQNRTELFAFSPGKRLPKPQAVISPRSLYKLNTSWSPELTSRVAAVQPRPPRSRVAKVKLCVCAQTASLLARERTRLLKDEQEFFKELVHFQARERDLNSVCEQLENSKRRFQQEKVSEWEAKEKHVDDLRAEMAELERRLDEVERESKKCAAAMQERRRQMKSWEKQLCWKEAELEKKIAISGEEKAKELAQWDQKMEDLRGRREKLVKGGVLSEGGSDLAATVTKLESAVEEKRVCTSSRRAVLRPERDRARAAQAKIKALQEELKSLEAQKAHDSKRKSDVVAATNKLRAVVAMLTHKADDEINPQIARETEVLADWHNKLATLRGENDELEQTLVMRTRRIEERFLQRKAEAEAAQLLSGRESLADGGEDERELRVTMAELNIASLKESHAALQRAILAFQECCLADADPDRSTKVKASSSVGGRGRSSMSRMSSGRAPTSRTPTTSSAISLHDDASNPLPSLFESKAISSAPARNFNNSREGSNRACNRSIERKPRPLRTTMVKMTKSMSMKMASMASMKMSSMKMSSMKMSSMKMASMKMSSMKMASMKKVVLKQGAKTDVKAAGKTAAMQAAGVATQKGNLKAVFQQAAAVAARKIQLRQVFQEAATKALAKSKSPMKSSMKMASMSAMKK
eukprot:g11954.t1